MKKENSDLLIKYNGTINNNHNIEKTLLSRESDYKNIEMEIHHLQNENAKLKSDLDFK